MPIIGEQRLETSFYLGASLRQEGRYQRALTQVCESLTIRRSLLPPTAYELAGSVNNLGLIEAGLGNGQEAAALQNDAARLQQGSVGDDDPAGRAIRRLCKGAIVS